MPNVVRSFSLTDVANASGASITSIRTWLDRIRFRTVPPPRKQGVPRTFSLDNVYEIAFTARLVECGFTPAVAAHIAGRLIDGLDQRDPYDHYTLAWGKNLGTDAQLVDMPHAPAELAHKIVELEQSVVVIIPVAKIMDGASSALIEKPQKKKNGAARKATAR